MDARTEFRFLQELRFLASNARYYLDAARSERARWQAAHSAFETAADPRRTRPAKMEPPLAAAIEAQTEFFAHVDALLATLGRVALILFGQGKSPKPPAAARAEHLQALLGIGTSHTLADKDLRNAWTHYDEYLDKLGPQLSLSDRFVRSADLAQESALRAIRTFEVDTMRIHFASVGSYELGNLLAAVNDLDKAVHQALGSWAARWPHEEGN